MGLLTTLPPFHSHRSFTGADRVPIGAVHRLDLQRGPSESSVKRTDPCSRRRITQDMSKSMASRQLFLKPGESVPSTHRDSQPQSADLCRPHTEHPDHSSSPARGHTRPKAARSFCFLRTTSICRSRHWLFRSLIGLLPTYLPVGGRRWLVRGSLAWAIKGRE